MAKKAASVLLALLIVLASPGGSGWLAFAAQPKVDYTYDTRTEKMLAPRADAAAEDPLSALKKRLSDPALRRKVSSAQLKDAEDFVRRNEGYLNAENITPEAGEALRAVVKDLDDQSKEAALTLGSLFERLSEYARSRDALGTYVDVVSRDGDGQTICVRSHALGKALFCQKPKKLGYDMQSKEIRRPTLDDPKGALDAVILEIDRGAAQDQKVAYNRRLVMLFRSVKQYYFDQPYLKRKIKEAKAGKADDPSFDLKEAEKEFNDRQAKFRREAGIVLKYLEWLDGLGPEGLERVAQLDAEELFELAGKLEEVQRVALRFYNGSQLLDMQKAALQQITYYFSQVTNTSPKKKKESSKASKGDAKELDKLQKVLGEYQKGSLESYAPFMGHFGITKLSPEDRKFITPELLALASEAFSAVAYAGRAHQGSLQKGLSSEEIDAAVEESQQWLRVAQVHLQSFDLQTLTIQVERLKLGQLRDRVGLDRNDQGMKDQADKLIKASRSQYLPRLEAEARATQKMLLKQAVASFHMTYLNAVNAHLYADTLKERVRAMAAKAAQMRALYLALEFDKVKNSPKYKGRFTAENKLEGAMYGEFLKNLSGRVERNARDLEKLSKDLNDLAGLQVAEEIRAGLKPAEEEFNRLAAELGFDEIPDLAEVQKEASALSIKQGKIFSAISDFSNRMRFFDNFNELDIYLRKYASSERAASESDTVIGYLVSFKWLEQGYGKLPFRDKLVDLGMANLPWFSEAFAKLGGEKNRRMRGQVLEFLRRGRYEDAYRKVAEMDPDLARKAAGDYEREKAEEDPFEALDFESYMSRAGEDKGLMRALEVSGGHFGLFSKYMVGYSVASAAVDAGFTTVMTAGFGMAASYSRQIAGWRMAAYKEGLVAKGSAFARGMSAWEASKQYGRLHQLLSWGQATGQAWVSNLSKAVDNVKIAEDLYKAKNWAALARNAGKQFRTTALVNSAKATGLSMATMGLASGGTQAVHHWMSPDTSQYKSKADAFGQGVAFGASFGAKGSLVMMMSPVQSTAFGAHKFGNALRAMANTHGPLSGALQFGAKIVSPKSALAEFGPLQAMQTAAVGKNVVVEWAANPNSWFSPAWFGAMADGAGKYWLAAEGPNLLTQYGHFAYTGAKEKLTGKPTEAHAGATPYVTRLAMAQDRGVLVSQAAWLFVPVNPMYSPSEIKAQVESAAALSHFLRENRGLEIERMKEYDKITDPHKPWRLSTWKERVQFWKERTPLELTISEEHRKIAAEYRIRRSLKDAGGASMAELIAGALMTSKDHGKSTTVAEMISSAATGELKEVKESAGQAAPPAGAAAGAPAAFEKPAQGGVVDVRDMRRVTNESTAASKELFRREARRDKALRLKIMAVPLDGEFVYGKGTPGEVTVRGDKLRELKDMVSAEHNEARSLGWAEVGAAWRRGWDLLSGRTLETQADVLARGGRKGLSESAVRRIPEKLAALMKEVREASGQVAEAARELREGRGSPEKAAEASRKAEAAARRLAEAEAKLADSGILKAVQELPKSAERVRELARAEAAEMAAAGKTRELAQAAAAELETVAQEVRERSAEVLRAAEGEAGPRWEALVEAVSRMEEIAGRSADPKLAAAAGRLGLKARRSLELLSARQEAQGRARKAHEAAAAGLERAAQEAAAKAGEIEKAGSWDPRDRLDESRRLERFADELAQAGRKLELGGVLDAAKDLRVLAARLRQGSGRKYEAAMSQSAIDGAYLRQAAAELNRGAGEIRRASARDAATPRLLRELVDGVELAARGQNLRAGRVGGKTARELEEIAGRLEAAAAKVGDAAQAKNLIEATRSRVETMIASSRGLDRLALEHSRNSLESAIYTGFVNERLAKDFQAYKEGRLSRGKLRASIRLFKEVWEKGVFGQMFANKASDLKTREEYYHVPEKYQFKDARGRAIRRFNGLQEEMILQTLESIADGEMMIFDLMTTAGGKTLLGFVMLDFMAAYSRSRGRQGTIYVTTSGELVAQAREAYEAFFKGRKPPFEIITYGELLARQAQADSMGTLSPFQTHDMFWDEAEQPGTQVPLALGTPNGEFSRGLVDPVFRSLRGSRLSESGPGWGLKELWREGGIFDPRDINMSEGGFARKLQNETFRRRWDDYVLRTTVRLEEAIRFTKTRAFRDSIDASLYPGMTREQIYAQIMKEHQKAFGDFFHMGVIEEQRGNLANWVSKILMGGYLLRSERDLSKTFKVDRERKRAYMMNNDTVYESLDTVKRSAISLLLGDAEGYLLLTAPKLSTKEVAETVARDPLGAGKKAVDMPHELDFGTVNVTTYGRLNEAGREGGTLVVAASGTLADGMIEFMAGKVRWKIQGKGTTPPKNLAVRVLEGQGSAGYIAQTVEGVHKKNVEAEKAAGSAKPGEPRPPKDAVSTYFDSVDKTAEFLADLAARGITEDRISLMVYPGSNFDVEKLLKGADVEARKNLSGIRNGTVDVIIFCGQAGLRGVDVNFEAYKGGRIPFFTTDPATLALVNQKQLFGRLYGTRVPEGTIVDFILLAEGGALRGHQAYQGLLHQKAREAYESAHEVHWDRLAEKLIQAGGHAGSLDRSVEALLKKHKLERGSSLEESVVKLLEKDAMLYEARDLYMDYLTASSLRRLLGQERLKEILSDRGSLSQASADPEVFKILVWPVQREFERQALQSSGTRY